MLNRDPAYLDAAYLAMFALFSAYVFVVPIVFGLRYRYYAGQLRGTVYWQQFRVGWPLTTAGAEMVSVGGAILAAWLLRWPAFSQDQWLRMSVAIFSLGVLCFLAGQSVIYWKGDPFSYLRERARRTSSDIGDPFSYLREGSQSISHDT